nr:MAG TPA: hypothetical protein [Caudoviricetes sp.]
MSSDRSIDVSFILYYIFPRLRSRFGGDRQVVSLLCFPWFDSGHRR